MSLEADSDTGDKRLKRALTLQDYLAGLGTLSQEEVLQLLSAVQDRYSVLASEASHKVPADVWKLVMARLSRKTVQSSSVSSRSVASCSTNRRATGG